MINRYKKYNFVVHVFLIKYLISTLYACLHNSLVKQNIDNLTVILLLWSARFLIQTYLSIII